MNKYIYFYILCILTLANFNSCSSGCIFDFSLVEKNDKLNVTEIELPQAVHTDVYIDYSDGMPDVLKGNLDFVQIICNMTDKNGANYYKVGKGITVVDGNIFSSTNPSLNPRDPNNYQEKMSDLDVALDQIINNTNSESIFITDFELYKSTGIDSKPWAIRKFEAWFEKGGQIDILAKPFKRKEGNTQYLYVLLFTPKMLIGNANPASIFNQLQNEGYLSTSPKEEVEWLQFGFGSHKIVKTEKKGLHQNLVPQGEKYKENKYEYYSFKYAEVHEIFSNSTYKEKYIVTGFKDEAVLACYKNAKISAKTFDMTNIFCGKPSEGILVENVFSYTEKNETYSLCLTPEYLKAKNGSLPKPYVFYKVEIWLEGAELNINPERMKSVLEWNRNGLQMEALNQSLQAAIKRQAFPKQLLYTYYIHFINS